MTRVVHVFRQLVVWVFVVMCTAHQTHAQGIRGRVVAAGTEVPLAGAIVQARTADGIVAASTLTSERGAFTVADLPDGTYTLRVLRIGFRAFDGPPVAVSGGTSEVVVLSWIGDAITLAPQIIASGRTCKVSADSGTMISNVWTEVRKALLSAVLAERGEAPMIVRTNYARTLELKSELVQQQRLSVETRRSFRAYASWAPESLATFGYMSEGVVAGRPAMIYRAPDAVTLTAESFAGTHCFSLVNGTGNHARDIGLAFEPNGRPNNRVDIRGTFWIERLSSRLQLIEFNYVGLPSYANPVKSGGFVEFVGLTTGQWLLSRWHIRMPHVAVQRVNEFAGSQERLEAVDEWGGGVTRVSQGDSVIYSHALPSLTVSIVGAPFMSERVGAKIMLVGTDLRATTNAQGRVVFRNIIAGKYNLLTTFSSLAMFGAQTSERFVTVDSSDKVDSVVAPNARALLRTACGTRADRNGVVALFGTVRDSAGNVADGGDGVVWSRAQSDDTISRVASIGALIDMNGQFLLCGTARGDTRVRGGSTVGASDRLINVASDAELVEVPLRVRPAPTASVDSSASGLAVIEFRIIDAEALPVPRIRINVIDVNGKGSSVITDRFGRAFLLDQPLGRAGINAGPGATASPVLTAGRNLVTIVLPEPPQ